MFPGTQVISEHSTENAGPAMGAGGPNRPPRWRKTGSEDDELEGDGVADAESFAGAFGVGSKEGPGIVGAPVEVGQIELVAAQRGDASIDVAGHVGGMRSHGRGIEGSEANARPRRPAFRKQPRVRRITNGIEQGPTDGTMVRVVPTGPAPTITMVDRQDHLRLVTTDSLGQVTPQGDARLDEPVRVIEELDDRYTDGCATTPLLLLADRPDLVRRHRGDTRLAAGHQKVANVLAEVGPTRHGARRAVLHVVGMGDDAERPAPILGNGFQSLDHLRHQSTRLRAMLVPMDAAELAVAADENLAATWALLGRAIGADVAEIGSLTLVAIGVPLAFFNGAFMRAASDEPERLIAAAIDFFGERGLPWLLWARENVATAVLDAGRRLGLRDAGGPPGMGLDPIPECPAPPVGLTIEIATTPEALVDHASVLRDGFGMPQHVVDQLIRPGLLDEPRATAFVGRVDGTPVSCSLLSVSGTTAGVYNVATPESFRSKGYGAALTWAAIAEGARRGCTHAVLQASPSGYPVYQRMGFTDLGRYVQLEGPPHVGA